MISSKLPILVNTPNDLDYIELLVATDMHKGSAQFDDDKWDKFEKQLEKPNTFVVFCGDQMEYATRTSKSDVYSQKVRPAEQKHWWIDHMKRYPDKVLAIVDGNHEFNRASKEADCFPLYDIALAIGIEDRYRSEAAFIDIGVGKKKRQVRYVGRLCHKAQNNVNYGTADTIEGIDFFVSGHTHKPMDKPLGKLAYDNHNKTIRERSVENIVGGHFLEYGGYVERAGMRVSSQKLYSLILNGKKKNIETRGFYL